ncbi:MerR family transcriptional regulator [Paenibacillus azoreducens]|uniref:MerR family transcriptional regulator n=1 Tax=Paenibacillus azoreducens TaxID=116718 RepID=UPI0039F59779
MTIFKIGEFSKLTQVSIRMLRYYDETGLLKPAQIDKLTGYRHYSVEQIPDLQKIILLRDLGYNVAEIAVALSNWSDGFLTEQLKQKRREIENTIRQEKERLAKMNAALSSIGKDEISKQYNFMLKQVPSYPVVSVRRVIPNYFCEGELWGELTSMITCEKIDIAPQIPGIAIYHDQEFKEEDVDVEVCLVVRNFGRNQSGIAHSQTEQVDLMACAMVYGPFENIKNAYLSFAKWLTEHSGYRMAGPSRQICHRNYWNETSPDQYLTEIQIPLGKFIQNRT